MGGAVTNCRYVECSVPAENKEGDRNARGGGYDDMADRREEARTIQAGDRGIL